MQPALLTRLRPLGPWRSGSLERGADGAGALFPSDRLYSAVSLAMQQLGWLEQWLDASARAAHPAVAFSSLFPAQRETLFAPPPATLWPPETNLVKAPNPAFLAKIRWSAARFVPISVIESLANGQPILADQWLPDAESGCLLRRDRPNSSPFRYAARTSAAVDRITRASVHPKTWSCIEFESGSGLWSLARFADDSAESMWKDRVKAAFRLLEDTGFGGRRTSGWGQLAAPQFEEGSWPGLLFPKLAARNGSSGSSSNDGSAMYLMLSSYSPSNADSIDWTNGEYRLTTRAGRIQSAAGAGREKKLTRVIIEGSVLAAQREPIGTAVDVAPEGFAHPVYRSGFALALKLPGVEAGQEPAVETASEEDGMEARPCEPAPQAEAATHPEPATEREDAASIEPPAESETAPEATSDEV